MSDEIRVKVHSYGEGRNLSLVWFDPVSGKKCAESTGTRNMRAAERKAGEREKELNAGTYARPSKLTWADFRAKWLAEKGPEVSPRTEEATMTAFNHVQRVLNPDRLAKLTTANLTKFKGKLRAEGMKETTIASHLRSLLAALSWAHGQGLLAAMPKVERPKRAKGQRFMRGRPITAEEFDRVLGAVPDVRPDDADAWTRYLNGLWLSGLRLEESLALSWEPDAPFAVDLTGRRPRFRIRAEAQKGARDELLPMTPDFAEWLLATPEAERHGRVFRLDGLQTGEPITPGRVGRIVGKFGIRARVVVNRTRKPVWEKQPDGSRRKVVKDDVPEFATAHTFRRSFGSRWARRVPTATLQKLMRHASIETTMRYYVDLNADDLADDLWAAWAPAAAESGNTEPAGNTSGNNCPQQGAKAKGVPTAATAETPSNKRT